MLIAFSGLKGSGKDTAAEVLIEEYGFTRIAFADVLRESLVTLDPLITIDDPSMSIQVMRLSKIIDHSGWDWAKNNLPEVRRLLQVFGTEVGRQLFGQNVWIDILKKRFSDMDNSESRYVITDCRFENEASFVDSKSGSIVWIDRPGLTTDGHASESGEVRKWRNWLITNDKSIDDLKNDVRDIMRLEGIDPIVRGTTSKVS